MAQVQAPQAPPAPAAPVKVPAPPAPPAPPAAFPDDFDVHVDITPEMQFKIDAAMDQAERMRFEFGDQAKDFTISPDVQVKIDAAMEKAQRMKFEFADQSREWAVAAAKGMAMADKFGQFAFAPQVAMPNPMPMPAKVMNYRGMSDDRLYSSGQNSLDNRQWDQAVGYFNQVISRNTGRVDGALYWKAYALGRLGRRDEAAASLAELRKSYATSRWLDDAKALELELKQASGQTVSPEAESDEELKLMAINGLMQSDPERAFPLLEALLKSSASPKVKRNTLFVLSTSNSPKAQALVEQIARGAGNPDLQVKAINYMNERRRNSSTNNGQILSEIYAATNDTAVKRAILQAYANMRDKDRLLQAAKTEKTPELREFAIGALAGNQGTPELWQLYQTETTSEGKIQLLRYMYSNSNSDKLLEVVKTEKDPKVREDAMRVLASQRGGVSSDALVSLYSAETEPRIKQSIVDGLSSQRNAKALVDIARAEKDTKLKLRIVERLSNMKSKEANDYLEELLKK